MSDSLVKKTAYFITVEGYYRTVDSKLATPG